MDRPRVSVVIPTYNRAALLVEAVQSALAQTFGDLEVIVADDGSTDGSAELVAGLGDERVEVLRLDHSGIPAVARNAAFSRSRGEFVAFLDSDDVWIPEKLERQLAVLNRSPGVGLVCSNASVIDENGNEIRDRYLPPDQGSSGDVLEELLDVNFVVNSSTVARRELVERVGAFSEDPRLRAVEDYDLWLRLGATCEVVYLAEELVGYREHRESVRADVPRTAYWAGVLGAVENLDRFVEAGDVRRKTLVRPRRARLLVQLARAELTERGPVAAARTLGKAVQLDPAAVARVALRKASALA
jgi:glycosyltransferase involved in cell wall biosynthesis